MDGVWSEVHLFTKRIQKIEGVLAKLYYSHDLLNIGLVTVFCYVHLWNCAGLCLRLHLPVFPTSENVPTWANEKIENPSRQLALFILQHFSKNMHTIFMELNFQNTPNIGWKTSQQMLKHMSVIGKYNSHTLIIIRRDRRYNKK